MQSQEQKNYIFKSWLINKEFLGHYCRNILTQNPVFTFKFETHCRYCRELIPKTLKILCDIC